MYYGALLNHVESGDFYRGKGAVRFEYVKSKDLMRDASLVLQDDKLKIVSGAKENLFMQGIQGVDPSEKLDKKLFKLDRYDDLSYADVQDSEENPLIIVLCKKINFIQGTKAFVKYVQLQDYILAVLVYGVCEFVNDDDEPVFMSRCYSADTDGKQRHTYTAEDMKRLSRMVDPESGYEMGRDAVCAVVVDYSGAKSGAISSVSYKTVGSCVKIFDARGLTAAREKAAAKKAQEEAEKKRKHEEMMAFEAARKAKLEEEARNAKNATKLKTEKVKKPVTVSEKHMENMPENEGARAFMEAFYSQL